MGLMKKLTAAIATSSLVVTMVGMGLTGVANAAYTPANGELAGARMQKLGIVQGRGTDGDLQLNAEITRAELATIIVRAFGQEDNAKLLQGAAAFPDTAKHWASGNIAMAKALVEKAGGDAIGMPDGSFNPDGKLTPAQSVAFLMKFLGVKRDATKAWPQDYLSAAVTAGLITSDDAAVIAPMLNQNATRGLVFYMFDRAFATYPVETGKTFYTKYVDTVAPVLTVDKVDATTVADSVTITGTAKDATEVFVGADKATLNADGSFSFKYSMPELKEYPITVTAKDLAGNAATQQLSVTRTTGSAATIDAQLGSALLKAGATTDLTVTVKDKAGNVIKDAAYDVKVDAAVGTYADGKITAAAKPATGSITITSGDATAKLDVAVVAGDLAKIEVTGATTAKIGQALSFTAKGYDLGGNEVTLTNVAWSATKGGVMNPSTGDFAATASGPVTVTAAVGDVKGTLNLSVFGDASALAMDIPTGLIANGNDAKTISVKVVDANGAVVGNSTQAVTLSISGGKLSLKDASGNAKATLSANAVNGVATFSVFQPLSATPVAGDYVASNSTLSVIGGTLTGAVGTVSSVAPTAGSIKIVSSPSAAVIENSGTVSVKAKVYDTTGQAMPAPSAMTLTLSATGTSGALSANLVSFSTNDLVSSAVTFTPNGLQGDMTISGTTTAGLTVTPLAFTTRIAGPAYQMVVTSAPTDNNADSGSFEMKVAIQDGLGTTKTTDIATVVTATAKNSLYSDVTATATAVNGIADLTFNSSNTTPNAIFGAGTWSFTVSSGNLVAPAAVTANVTAGSPAKLGDVKVNGTKGNATLSANGTQTATVSVSIVDAHGNKVPGATNAVTFKANQLQAVTGISTTGTTVNAVDGVASVTVTTGVVDNGTTTITATGTKADGSALTTGNGSTITTQIVGPAASIDVPAPDDVTQEAGTTFTVTADVLDATAGGGRFVSTDNGRAVSLAVYDHNSTLVTTLNSTTVNGVASFDVNLTTAGTYTFKATANFNGTDKTSGASAVTTVDPTTASKVVLTQAKSLTSVETGTAVALAADVEDSYGNSISGWTVQGGSLDWYLDGTKTNVGATKTLNITDPANIVYTAPNTTANSVISEVDGKVTVKIGTAAPVDLPVSSYTISTYIAGPAYQVKVVSDPAAVTAAGISKIKVGVYDGAGNLKTNDSATKVDLVVPTGVTNPDNTVGDGTTAFVAQGTVDHGTYSFAPQGATIKAAGTYQFQALGTAGTTSLVKSPTFSLVVNPDSAVKVVSPADVTMVANGSVVSLLTFKVTDTNGNTVPSFTGTMKFSATGAGAVLLSSSAPIVNGQASIQVQATTTSGTLVITPVIDGSTWASSAYAAVKVVVGSNQGANSTLSTASLSGGTAVVQLRDANGNAVSGQAVKLQQVDNLGANVAGAFTEVGTSGVYTAVAGVGAVGVKVTLPDNTTFTLNW